MKLIKSILLTLVITFSFTNDMHAQILKKLKKRVQQAAEQTVIDKTAEKAAQETGKAMDSLLDIDPDYRAQTQEQLLNKYLQADVEIPIEDVYTFDTNVVMEMFMEENNKPVTVDYSMWFSGDKNYMAAEMKNIDGSKSKDKNIPGGMLTIMDDKNQALIMILEAQKMAQVVSMESVKDIADQEKLDKEALDTSTPKLQKTGRSKKILDYNCEEFETQTEEGKVTFWITQDLRLFKKNMFANLNNSLGGNPFQNIPEAAKGFMMEMHFEHASNGQKSAMYVKNISKKNKTIQVQDYQLMNLSGLMKN